MTERVATTERVGMVRQCNAYGRSGDIGLSESTAKSMFSQQATALFTTLSR